MSANRRPLSSLLLVVTGLALAPSVHAALQDEVQVYTDDINPPGAFSTEVHINATPRGVALPAYAGEVGNHRGLRITPEFSWGLTRSVELGLYLPVTRTGDGTWYGAGVKFRLKWLPLQAGEQGGWFGGINTELSQLKQPFSESARSVEVRTILGWKNAQWLLAVNPIFGWDISPGYRHHSPEFTVALKVARRFTSASHWGFEYYNGVGRINQRLPSASQEKSLFLAWDYEGKPLNFNFGIGRGLNSASDAWTIKTILDLPF